MLKTAYILVLSLPILMLSAQERMDDRRKAMAVESLTKTIKAQSNQKVQNKIRQHGGAKPSIRPEDVRPLYEDLIREHNEYRKNLLLNSKAEHEEKIKEVVKKMVDEGSTNVSNYSKYLENSENQIVQVYTDPLCTFKQNIFRKEVNVGDIGHVTDRKVEIIQVLNKDVALVDWGKYRSEVVSSRLRSMGAKGPVGFRSIKEPQFVFLEMDTSKLHDGAQIKVSGLWYFDKTHTYTTILGAQSTLPVGKKIEASDILK